MNDFERMLGREGTVIVKFFLHISKAAQLDRFRYRLEWEEKCYKCSADDAHEWRHSASACSSSVRSAWKASSGAPARTAARSRYHRPTSCSAWSSASVAARRSARRARSAYSVWRRLCSFLGRYSSSSASALSTC